jgi:hypothetical protein
MPENKLPAGRTGGLVHQTQTQTIYQGPLDIDLRTAVGLTGFALSMATVLAVILM